MSCHFFSFDEDGNFETVKAVEWISRNKVVPITAVVLYLSLIYAGRKWMESRPAFNLKWSLNAWNTALSTFSVFGLTMGLLPNFIKVISTVGMRESMCALSIYDHPSSIGMWYILFLFSKIFEFGDTVFIVLRKSKLPFLHWYHHVTVLLYAWFAMSAGMFSAGYWFATVNYSVHVLMYGYYALRSIGTKVPSNVALFITLLQIFQMFLGLYVNFVLYTFNAQGRTDCYFNWTYFYLTCCLFGSYALLFLHFFFNRYVLKSKTKTA